MSYMDAARALLLFTLLTLPPGPLLVIPIEETLLSKLFTFIFPMLMLLPVFPFLFELPKLELVTLLELIFILRRPPRLELA